MREQARAALDGHQPRARGAVSRMLMQGFQRLSGPLVGGGVRMAGAIAVIGLKGAGMAAGGSPPGGLRRRVRRLARQRRGGDDGRHGRSGAGVAGFPRRAPAGSPTVTGALRNAPSPGSGPSGSSWRASRPPSRSAGPSMRDSPCASPRGATAFAAARGPDARRELRGRYADAEHRLPAPGPGAASAVLVDLSRNPLRSRTVGRAHRAADRARHQVRGRSRPRRHAVRRPARAPLHRLPPRGGRDALPHPRRDLRRAEAPSRPPAADLPPRPRDAGQRRRRPGAQGRISPPPS